MPNTKTNNRFSTRPSDLLPWSDPFIARLVTNLQDEVRHERNLSSTPSSNNLSRGSSTALQAEIEPAGPQTESDWQWQEEPRWTHYDKI